MPAKLIMRWDIRPEKDSEYFEFLVHEFIPGLNKLGIIEIQVWFTQFGECEQKMASGITQSISEMKTAMKSEEWEMLIDKLNGYVNNFSQKVINATGGFQV
ncbi:MAG: hypothetical protein DWQ04_02815 [Chloroflexi bacterium]|nr:MAG: hypothetical protein DWQ04_02815 [Chloroflexota bacterium]